MHFSSHLPFVRQLVSDLRQLNLIRRNFTIFFSLNIGYGNISPSTTTGRMFMIFYALIGIPMNGFLFAYLGDFFAKVVKFYFIKHFFNFLRFFFMIIFSL